MSLLQRSGKLHDREPISKPGMAIDRVSIERGCPKAGFDPTDHVQKL